ncbi:MAG: recombinase family protein [Clostridia bacterium]|nr:recombinase family protein [Clostridia bacterium]
MEFKIGAAYVRVSTDDQLEYSPDSQLKLIRDYAKREGYIIPDEFVYRDDGISGKSADKRPAFQMMVATAKEQNPPFSCIFVWKFSRFARNQEESLVYKNLLKRNGVAVRSISEPSMDDSPFSGLIESIISWMDEYYLTNLAGEVRRGMKEKAMRGEAMGKPPFGYDVKDKVLVPNDSADAVRYIFKRYAAGGTFRSIASELNDSGIKTNLGKPFEFTAVQYILMNPAYIGKTRWSEDEHKPYRYVDPDAASMPDGKHEPLIAIELWDTVQERLAKRSTGVRYARKGKPVFMLKGLLRCDNCGSTLVNCTNQKAGQSLRLQCCGYMRGQCKVSHFITVEKADAAVLDALETMIHSGSFVFAPQKPPEVKISRDWDKLITQEKNRLERAKNALLDGAFSSAEYKELKAGVEANIAKLEAAKAQNEPHAIDAAAFKPKAIEVLSILRSPDVDGETKNAALRSIVEKIVFKKLENTFDIYFLP